MNCTGKRCVMQKGTVDPATCPAASYCPEVTPPIESEMLVKFLKLTEDRAYLIKKALELYLSAANDFLSYDEYMELSIEVDGILRNLGYEEVDVWKNN